MHMHVDLCWCVCVHSIGNNTKGMHTIQIHSHTHVHTNWERRQVSHIDFRRSFTNSSKPALSVVALVIIVTVVGVVIVVVFMYSN